MELASGLSVLSGGTSDTKIRAAFALYNYIGDGFITQDEMIQYLTAVFKAMYHAEPGTAEDFGCSPIRSWPRSPPATRLRRRTSTTMATCPSRSSRSGKSGRERREAALRKFQRQRPVLPLQSLLQSSGA